MTNYFRIFLAMISGATFMLGMFNGFTALKQRPVKINALFLSVSSLALSVYAFTNIRLYSAVTPEAFLSANRIDMFCNAIILISLLLFFKRYTGFGHRIFVSFLCILFFILPFIRLTSPGTLTYTNIQGIKFVVLPWGETLSLLKADTTLFALAYYTLGLLCLFYYLIAAIRHHIGKRNFSSLSLLIGVITIVLSAINDISVDTFSLNWIYLTDFGFNGILFFMTVSLNRDLFEASKLRVSLVESHQKREQAEIEIELKEQKYLDIFNSSNDAILVFDPITRIIADVNNSMLRIYNCGKEEVLGHPLEKFSSGIPPYDKDNIAGHIVSAIEKGFALFEWQASKPGGELFWVEMSLKYSKIGLEEKMIAVIRDITERRLTQEILVQNEKMHSLGGLAAGMAHEINNPLAGIVQTAHVLANRLGITKELASNEEAAESAGTSMDTIEAYLNLRNIPRMFESIRDSAGKVTTIVDNMLSFSRKSDGSKSYKDLREILDQTLIVATTDHSLINQYNFKKIEICKNYEPDLPQVACEGSKIQQVFFNILRNSAQAMQDAHTEQPCITLSISYNTKTKMVVISIEDNGPGMAEEVRRNIFEPFFTTKPEGKGTGLGLSVSYFIICENHRGEMRVESKPGYGAKFIIGLPQS